jgi:hypothetical protein
LQIARTPVDNKRAENTKRRARRITNNGEGSLLAG